MQSAVWLHAIYFSDLHFPGHFAKPFEHALRLQAHVLCLQRGKCPHFPRVPAHVPLLHQLPDHLQVI